MTELPIIRRLLTLEAFCEKCPASKIGGNHEWVSQIGMYQGKPLVKATYPADKREPGSVYFCWACKAEAVEPWPWTGANPPPAPPHPGLTATVSSLMDGALLDAFNAKEAMMNFAIQKFAVPPGLLHGPSSYSSSLAQEEAYKSSMGTMEAQLDSYYAEQMREQVLRGEHRRLNLVRVTLNVADYWREYRGPRHLIYGSEADAALRLADGLLAAEFTFLRRLEDAARRHNLIRGLVVFL